MLKKRKSHGHALKRSPSVERKDNQAQHHVVAERENSALSIETTMDTLSAEKNRGIRQENKKKRRDDWLFTAIAFWSVILIGACLRFWDLGDRPLHHDESLHGYFSMQLMHNLENWHSCLNQTITCYQYDPLMHGPFQFHIIALVYKLADLMGMPEHGINLWTARIAAATLGTALIGLPFFLRDYLGKSGAWLACFLLAISPGMVYFSRFSREDIYMAFFTLLLVISVARYMRDRKGLWLSLALIGLVLAYATKEATFLMMAVFGSFLGALVAWEMGAKRQLLSAKRRLWFPKTASLFFLIGYFLLLGIVASIFFGWMKSFSLYLSDPASKEGVDVIVQQVKDLTVSILPWLGLCVCGYACWCLFQEMMNRQVVVKEHGLAHFVSQQQQPVLYKIATIPMWHWFIAMVCSAVIFVVLFSVIFTNVHQGIGDGIWQGLYYWLQQQHVARGGQPWYYYLTLIPLYEQLGVVFGLLGGVICLRRPSRFRLFLVYWVVGNLVIYSWAGEKMPWLMVHITMPLMLLAAIGLRAVLVAMRQRFQQQSVAAKQDSRRRLWNHGTSRIILGGSMSIFLLMLTLCNMVQVNYVYAAEAPREMMVYVQTSRDVHLVMEKIAQLDAKLHVGKHKLSIGVTSDASWPFYWYLREYTNVCYNFPQGCTDTNPAVIVSAGDTLASSQTQYATPSVDNGEARYQFQRYRLRTWWDEGYKPPPCVPSATESCEGKPTWGGQGLLLWLSYGNNPPAEARGNLELAAKNVWQWWWHRQPIGSTMGSTDMGFLVRKDLEVTP